MSDSKEEQPQMPVLLDDVEKNAHEQEKDWNDWHADEDDESSQVKTKCVACSEMFDTCEQCLAHIKLEHEFDLVSFVMASTDDPSMRMYFFIKLVNYLRSLGPRKRIQIEGETWKEDKFLTPLKETEDPLLLYHLDDISGEDAPFRLPATSPHPHARPFKDMPREELESRLEKSIAENTATHEKLAYLEQHLASLQRLNKSLLDGTHVSSHNIEPEG